MEGRGVEMVRKCWSERVKGREVVGQKRMGGRGVRWLVDKVKEGTNRRDETDGWLLAGQGG